MRYRGQKQFCGGFFSSGDGSFAKLAEMEWKMETIRSYLDNVFAGMPDSADVRRLKAEMLANMEEKYFEMKATGKSENEAVGAVIADFGNVEELFSEMGIGRPGADFSVCGEGDSSENRGRTADSESDRGMPEMGFSEVDAYIKTVRKSSVGIAAGVAMIIAGAALLVVIGSGRLDFAAPYASEESMNTLGFFAFFLLLVPAIGLLVYFGMKLSPWEHLGKGGFRLDMALRPALEAEFQASSRSYPVKIAIGVILCITSVPVLVALETFPQSIHFLSGGDLAWELDEGGFGVFVMLLIIAVAVFIFILAGMRHDMYRKLLKTGDYAQTTTSENRIVGVVASIIWPLTVVAFLIWGFCFGGWYISWILFPIVGILFGAFSAAVNAWTQHR
jgi:hypothetical protein